MTGTLQGVSNKHCLLSFFHFFLKKPYGKLDIKICSGVHDY